MHQGGYVFSVARFHANAQVAVIGQLFAQIMHLPGVADYGNHRDYPPLQHDMPDVSPQNSQFQRPRHGVFSI
jgi:hypothetical protein